MRRLGGPEGIDAVLQEFNLDALIVPSEGMGTVPAAFAGLLLHSRRLILTGYPIVTVPLGTLNKNGQPFGLSFLGTKHSEPTLIRLMAAFEDAFPPRAIPSQLTSSSGRRIRIDTEEACPVARVFWQNSRHERLNDRKCYLLEGRHGRT
jgi:amidase